HTLPGAAQAMIGFLAEVYGWPAPPVRRTDPLWDPAPPLVAVASPPSPVQPAASPSSPSLLVYAAARAAAEIGLTEDDTAALRSVAARIYELT
ncbi:MAG: glycosyl transferase family 1, partial [Chloroflexus sp.]